MTLKFKVIDYDITLPEKPILVADSINYITAEFEFEGQLCNPDYSYSAIFHDCNSDPIRVPLKDYKCTVPRLTSPQFKVGIMAVYTNDKGETAEIYSELLAVPLHRSCYSEKYSNAATPSEYAELISKMNELNEKIENTPTVTIDTEMSDTSENTVQNKVIKKYVDDLIGNIQSETDEINTIIGGEIK